MISENEEEVVSTIPQTQNTPTERIHENAIKAWRIAAVFYGLAWFIPPLFVYSLIIAEGMEDSLKWHETFDWIVFTIVMTTITIIYLLNIFLLPHLRWKRWYYQVSEKEIDLLRGIITIKRTLVPINRVQHVDTKQGPLYRRYGLSSVKISTAATTHEIPALDDKTAEELRNTISTLVRKVKDDV